MSVGDLIKLKSGGPPMTVEAIAGESVPYNLLPGGGQVVLVVPAGWLLARYFDENGDDHRPLYRNEMVIPYVAPPKTQ